LSIKRKNQNYLVLLGVLEFWWLKKKSEYLVLFSALEFWWQRKTIIPAVHHCRLKQTKR
jgi:hypothetical protein